MNEKTLDVTKVLAQVAQENGLAELEYENNEMKVRLVLEHEPRFPDVFPAAPMMVPQMPMAQPQPQAVPAVAPASTSNSTSAPEITGETVNSPLSGVFYAAPEPGAPAFVSEGQKVSQGQSLCIVEAMKLMNEIEAEKNCEIVKILVADAQEVSEGQPLFVIR